MAKVTRVISSGEMRCVQAAFRMVVLALVGIDPGAEKADTMTGYVEGRGTWQFRMLLALASYGLNVIDHEAFDIQEFLTDPEQSIRKQVGDPEIAAQNIAETDLDAEVDALRRCLESPRIQFINAVPSFDDLTNELKMNKLIMCNINIRVLEKAPGHLGHIVVVESLDKERIVFHDPNPPGILGRTVSIDGFYKAWTSPSEGMANYISVGIQG